MDKWFAIGILAFMLVYFAVVSTLSMFKLHDRVFELELQRLQMQEKIDILKDNGKSYLHRLNCIEYPEVLGKQRTRKGPR